MNQDFLDSELRAVHEHAASKLGAEHPVTAAARRFLATLLTEDDRTEEAAQFSSTPSR